MTSVGNILEQMELLKFSIRSFLVQPIWKTNWQYLLKLILSITCDSSILLLGVCSTESCAYNHQKTCSRMFTVLFAGQRCKKPKCPSVVVYSHNGIHSNKNEGITTTSNNLDQSQKQNLKPNKSNTKKYILYYYIFIESKNRQNYYTVIEAKM